MLAMTERGRHPDAQSEPQARGGDVSVAAGPVGAGVPGDTAGISSDLIIFSHAKGLYGGFSVDGGVLTPRKDLNEAYDGKAVTRRRS